MHANIHTLIYWGVVRLMRVPVKAKSCFLISVLGGNWGTNVHQSKTISYNFVCEGLFCCK